MKHKTVKQRPFVKGYRYPIYPTASQIELLEKTFGCCRFVWNRALAEAQHDYEAYLAVKDQEPLGGVKPPILTGYTFVNKLPKYKLEHDWLYEVSADVLQQQMLHLGAAFSKLFKERKGYPKFKKKQHQQSATLTTNCFRFKSDGELYIAKSSEPLAIGYGRKGHVRRLPSAPTSLTITKTATGRYYASFVCEYVPAKTHGTGEIGLDLGIKDFIASSDGSKIANPRHLKQHEANLRRKQQKLARCKKGSKRHAKARLAVAKIHEQIGNTRNDFQHQLSRRLINENQVIGLENLRVANMIRNSRLSKHIADAAWSAFVAKLIYKARESQHCNIVRVDTFYPSSQICNATDLRLDRPLRLSERQWLCPHCGQTHDRDINAAMNIRDQALLQLAIHRVPLNGSLVLAQAA